MFDLVRALAALAETGDFPFLRSDWRTLFPLCPRFCSWLFFKVVAAERLVEGMLVMFGIID
jgi:hypothetical protein